jgi:hypothetical protein
MKQLGLNIFLSGSQSIALLLTENEALKIVKDWQSNYYHIKGISMIGGITTDGVQWAVKIDSISGMHTFDIEKLRQQQGGIATKYDPNKPWNRSGIN